MIWAKEEQVSAELQEGKSANSGKGDLGIGFDRVYCNHLDMKK